MKSADTDHAPLSLNAVKVAALIHESAFWNILHWKWKWKKKKSWVTDLFIFFGRGLTLQIEPKHGNFIEVEDLFGFLIKVQI